MLEKPIIGVLGTGGSDKSIPSHTLQMAFQIGKEIVRQGAICLSGGMNGVMNAVSKGAREAGGIVVGITPILDRKECSPYLQVAITTGLGTVRNLLNIRAPDSLIAVGGGYGTLNELLLAYQDGKSAVVLEGSGGWSDRLRSTLFENVYFDERKKAKIYFASTPHEAVNIALSICGMRSSPPVDLLALKNSRQQSPHIGVLTPGTIEDGSDCNPLTHNTAIKIGNEIASHDAVLICDGGGAYQTAVCRGASEKGGITVGILGSMLKKDANPYVSIPIRTGLGEAAYPITVRSSDAVIVVGGDSTILNQMMICNYHKRPTVIVENSGGLSCRLRDILWEGKYLDWRKFIEFHFVPTAEEAVAMALELGYKEPNQDDPKFDLPIDL